MAGRYVGFGKKLFDLALGKGKSNVSTTITGVTPNVGTLKEFQKHKDDIIKSTEKFSKNLTDEGKIKIKKTVAPALSKLSKITKKKPVENKAKGGRVGLKSGNGFPDLSGDGKTTFKDILIGRGVIKKGKKKTMMAKSKTPMDKAVRKDKKKKRFV